MPKVSVIIPTYNRRARLERALDSVLHQTYHDFEVIVVDDGSTDGTGELDAIVENAGGKVRYCRLEHNRGVARARNAGAAWATGRWLAFLDSDDLWHPNKLQEQLEWLDRHPHIHVAQTRVMWIRDGRRVNPPAAYEPRGENLFEQSLARCMITPSAVIIDKKLFDHLGGFNESFRACEDYDLWLRVTCGHPVGLIDKHLATRYGGHEDQLSLIVPALDRFRVRSLIDLITNGLLDTAQRNRARAMLREKAKILANGYRKRGNHQAYEQYVAIAAWAHEDTGTPAVCPPGSLHRAAAK